MEAGPLRYAGKSQSSKIISPEWGGGSALSGQLLQWTAAVYLIAGLVAGLALTLNKRQLARVSVALLGAASLLHLSSFFALHAVENPPSLTTLSSAVSFMTWVGVSFFLLMLRRSRFYRLVVVVAPVAFLGTFLAALYLPGSAPTETDVSSSWSHAHILLSSAGSALLGLAGLVGTLFLIEHGRLKAKRPISRFPLPSLEALDRVNVVSLTAGFTLLTMGVFTGMFWLQAVRGTPWTGTAHETWSIVAWVVYAVLIGVRLKTHQGPRETAASSVGCFALLLFAVLGLGILT
jgi:ABC-type transport system involved in cytochrome c biogenesis permease subunit